MAVLTSIVLALMGAGGDVMNIQKAVLAVVLVVTTSVARAASRADQGDVPATMADVAAITSWAETHSWGGSSVEVLKSGDAEVAVVQRSFTSGMLTSGLVVFVRIDGHWEPGLIFRTVTGYFYKVSQDGDYVHLRNSSTGAEIGGFSISSVGQDYVGRTGKGRVKPGRESAAQPGAGPDGR